MKKRIKQKLIGLALIALGIISVPVCENDATAAALIVPLGVGVVLTKDDVIG